MDSRSSLSREPYGRYGIFHGYDMEEMAIMNEQSHSVLVVEDEEAIRTILSLSLELAGYTVHTASDGLEALDEMKQRRFDVVVTDYQMPGMDGL